MPKYAEGAMSPSGKQVVRGGRWVSVGEEDTAERDARREAIVAPAIAGAEQRSKGPGPGDPAFYGDPGDVQNIIEAGKFRGTAAAAGPSAAILAGAVGGPALGGAARGAGGLLRFARPAAGIAKDLVLGQGIEEAAKHSGIPGADVAAEVYLGAKGLKGGVSSFAKFLANRLGKRTVKGAATRTAGSAAARAIPAAAEGAAPAAAAAGRTAPKLHGERILELLQKQGVQPLRGGAVPQAPSRLGELVQETMQAQAARVAAPVAARSATSAPKVLLGYLSSALA